MEIDKRPIAPDFQLEGLAGAAARVIVFVFRPDEFRLIGAGVARCRDVGSSRFQS